MSDTFWGSNRESCEAFNITIWRAASKIQIDRQHHFWQSSTDVKGLLRGLFVCLLLLLMLLLLCVCVCVCQLHSVIENHWDQTWVSTDITFLGSGILHTPLTISQKATREHTSQQQQTTQQWQKKNSISYILTLFTIFVCMFTGYLLNLFFRNMYWMWITTCGIGLLDITLISLHKYKT